MESSYEETLKCIWHAFNALDDQQNGTVSRSKLKVFKSLNKLGWCQSITTTYRRVDALRKDFDEKIKTWKSMLSDVEKGTSYQEQPTALQETEDSLVELEDVWEDLDEDVLADTDESLSDSDILSSQLASCSISTSDPTGTDSEAISCESLVSDTETIGAATEPKRTSFQCLYYDVTFDNVNQKTSVRHHVRGKKNNILNLVQAYATKERIGSYGMSNRVPTSEDLKKICVSDFLPSEEDEVLLKKELSVMVSRTLTTHIPIFQSVDIEWSIPHEYSYESGLKSEIVPLGVLNKDESKTADTIDILEDYSQYIAKDADGKPLSILLHCDGLSCERVHGAKRARVNGEDDWDRLGMFEPCIQEWHRRLMYIQVLTHNLANAVGIEGLEEKLQDETVILDFNDYQEFIEKQLFHTLKQAVEDTDGVTQQSPNLDRLCDVCWVLCAKKFNSRAAKFLNDSDSQKMWKVFNFLVEPGNSEVALSIPLTIDIDEVKFILQRFADCTGSRYEPEKLESAVGDMRRLDFLTFIQAFENVSVANLKQSEVSLGVNDIFEEITQEVIKKGMMSKKGHMVTNWKDRWIVLTPTHLRYYTNRGAAAKDMKGELPITYASTVESLEERPSTKFHRFTLHTIGRKSYEFGVPDLKTKNEWIRGLELAIEYSGKPGQVQKVSAAERRKAREDQRSQLSEEERRRREEHEMIEKQRSELESERQARAQLEAKNAEEEKRRELFLEKLKEIERLREQEQHRLEELENKYQGEVAERTANLKNLRELQERYEEETAAREAHMKKVQELEEMCQTEERKLQDLESKYHDETSRREADLHRLQELETKYQEEAALREMDQQKLKELEEGRKELERLLEEERTARKDEEVVRCLQGRLLEEEALKREELERLARQQMALRVVEQQEREGLEEEKRAKEEALEEARKQLENLQIERKAADEKLAEAKSKLEEAQAERAKAQEKARLWKTPVGLARPIQPEPKPWITHRGEGAFVEADFHKAAALLAASIANGNTAQENGGSGGMEVIESLDEVKGNEKAITDDIITDIDNPVDNSDDKAILCKNNSLDATGPSITETVLEEG